MKRFLLASSIFLLLISCSGTYISFNSSGVLRGKWTAQISNEPSFLELNTTADNSGCPCKMEGFDDFESGYKILGTAKIGSTTYPIEGRGSLGVNSPPAALFPASFRVKIASDSSEITEISGIGGQDNYSITLRFRQSQSGEKYLSTISLEKKL
jgi:hypothetical protein